MKALIKTELFKVALNRVGSAVSSQMSLPILGCVKLEAVRSNLILSTTNLNLSVSDKASAKVDKEGACCVSYGILKSFVQRSDSLEIRLESKGKQLHVFHGENEGILDALPVDEFPPETVINGDAMTFSYEELVTPLRLIKHAICSDASRYTLQGVNIHRNAKTTELVATDARRLAFCRSVMPFQKTDVILPDAGVRVIIDLVTEGEIALRLSQSEIEIRNNNLCIRSRLIEGTFPRYDHLIPEQTDSVFSADRKELIRSLETASIFLTRNEVGVDLSGKGKALHVKAGGTFSTKLVGTELKDQPAIHKRVDHRYLLDALRVCESEDARIEVDEKESVLVLRERDFVEVIQGLRTADAPTETTPL